MRPRDWLLLAGCLMLVGGAAWIYAPTGLILAGLILIRGYAKLERKEKPDA